MQRKKQCAVLANKCNVFEIIADLEEEGLHNENDGDPSEEGDLAKLLRVLEDSGILGGPQPVQRVGHDAAIGCVGVVEQAVCPAKRVDVVLCI